MWSKANLPPIPHGRAVPRRKSARLHQIFLTGSPPYRVRCRPNAVIESPTVLVGADRGPEVIAHTYSTSGIRPWLRASLLLFAGGLLAAPGMAQTREIDDFEVGPFAVV